MFTNYIISCTVIGLISLTCSYPLNQELQNALFELGFIDLTQYGRSIFGEPDSSTGDLLAKFNPNVEGANPEELGSYLEGDILMPLGQARNGLSATSARWPNAVIPYEIRGGFGMSSMMEFLFCIVYLLKNIFNFRCISNEFIRTGNQ